MHFQALLDSDRFLIIGVLEPPKGTDTAELLRHADALRGRMQAVLVPEMRGAIMRMGSLGASSFLQQRGIETIMEVNCRDRNRLALQADLLSGAVLGVKNVLVSAGDEIKGGDHIEAKPVHDLNVVSLLEMLKKLQKGSDLAGNDLAGTPQFCVGSEVNAGLSGGALELEIQEMEKKIRAGANYFFTPTTYDLKHFENFRKRVAPFKIPVFPQVTILKSVGMARFMSRHMEGITIPEEVIERLGNAPDKKKEGIAIAADMIKNLKGLCRGVLLVAIGEEERLPAVLDRAEV
jgi:methylenetetrahydrofolate reductase (NADPH)